MSKILCLNCRAINTALATECRNCYRGDLLVTERIETVSKNDYDDLEKRFYQSNKERYEFEAKYDALFAQAEAMAEALKTEAAFLTLRGMLPIPEHISKLLEDWQKFKEQK